MRPGQESTETSVSDPVGIKTTKINNIALIFAERKKESQ